MLSGLVVLCLLAGLLGSVAGAEGDMCQDFSVRPQDRVAVLGELADIDCQHPDIHTVRWEKEGTTIAPSDNREIKENNTLRIVSVQEEDLGSYACVVPISFGLSVRCTATLRLAESPSITSPTGPGSSSSQTITLSALVMGDPIPNTEWSNKNEVLLPQNDSRIVITNTTENGGLRVTLTISMVTSHDRGVYRLVASSNFGSVMYSWNVPVDFVDVDDMEVEYLNDDDKTVRLTCVARTFPAYAVTWDLEMFDLASVETTTNFVPAEQHQLISSSVDVALTSCPSGPQVFKCIFKLGSSARERGVTVCQSSCTAPTITVVSVNCTAVRVTWDTTQAQPDNDIIIFHRMPSSSQWRNQSLDYTQNQVVIAGLMEGTMYEFRSSCNPGPFSAIVSFTTLAAPSVVIGVSVELVIVGGIFSASLQWQVSTDNDVIGYHVMVAKNNSWDEDPVQLTGQSSTSLDYPISCGTHYQFKVAAFNDYSEGPYSFPVQAMCDLDIPPQQVMFEALPNNMGSHFKPLATFLTVGFSLQQPENVEHFTISLEEQDEDFRPKLYLNYSIPMEEYSSSQLCLQGLTPNAQYRVCLLVGYKEESVKSVCSPTETKTEAADSAADPSCRKPTSERIESTDDESSDVSPTIPDWGIAVIVVGALVLVALLFCFLGLCFACQSSRNKDINFGSMSSLQTEREGVVAIRMHNAHPSQRAMSPTRSCLKYNKGHSTTWSDHVDTLRQMDTDNGTSV